MAAAKVKKKEGVISVKGTLVISPKYGIVGAMDNEGEYRDGNGDYRSRSDMNPEDRLLELELILPAAFFEAPLVTIDLTGPEGQKALAAIPKTRATLEV